MYSPLALVPAVLLGVAAAAQGVAAQDYSGGGAASSSSWSQQASGSAWSSTAAANATGDASGQANATASNTAAAPVSTSTQNPLIPSSISPKCQSFLTYLNSASSLSACTTPLLSALSSFQPSPDSPTTYTASSDQVHTAIENLCSQPSCDDSLVRGMLGGFVANCTAELEAKNQVVLGSYDALYVLEPLREAVCSTDSSGAFCVEDIAAGKVPSTPSNTTDSSNSTTTPVNMTALASSAAASSTAQTGSQLAAQTYTIPVPAPQALYVQITKVAKRWYRLAKRQYQGGSSSGSGSSWSSAGSSTAASPSSSSSSGSNSTAPSAGSTRFTPLALPSLLPNSQTWSTLSLLFLFLTPSMPSSTLCTPCTRTILASYIAFESRMPYALGLANSPLLGGQGALWTGVGEKCGSGFLEGVAKQAGEANLTGGSGSIKARAGGVVVALVAVVLAVAL
ncbi:hypothetical protein NBRC10512_002483 [Rhodotorula toruloides]|uniref:RHTO0S18e02982g1_1 n=2 Tax=Rhodotorula toruloides TaxID=5286 RepID=A0A061BF26_RHOTO|nr:uncharacterized protein RHTO_06507 [Rhodotorula toruloides NP11]EMS18282.1 hypothetical protein RHTO_06507 [Rhodotorula toruloides NP11]CDR48568.1 RHTO0S18e02982g1_1 [Rhodotorula toruloides]